MCNIEKEYAKLMEEKTVYYRNLLGFAPDETSTHNNKSDAFKHAFTSASLTLLTTFWGSLLLTNEHEWNNLDNHAPIDESVMDFHNNKIGRQIGLKALGWILTFRYSEKKMAELIRDKILSNELICSLSDDRIPYFKNYCEEIFDRKCDAERFKKYLEG